MHPYLPHLLSDIKDAERTGKNKAEISEPTSFEEEMEAIEQWVSGVGEQALSYFTGLKKENFPPGEQLSQEEMDSVVKAFDRMLETRNVHIDYPEDMPTDARYGFLRNNILEERVALVNSGFVHLDFCTGYAPDCQWGEYCSCRRFYDEENGKL